MGKENTGVKSRNYSPFQTTEKTATLQKQAVLRAQEAKKQREIAEKKSRNFSPFPKKQSSSPSSKLPYAASKTFDETDTKEEEVQSLWSLGKSFLDNIVHDLTPQNTQEEISAGGSDDITSNRDDGEHIDNDATTPSMATETRSYSPFQETDKTIELRKEAIRREQEAIIRLRRQEEINETLARKLRIERDVAEKKSRSFSPFVKKESSSSSATLPYSASAPLSESDSEMINSVAWAPGKAVHQ